MAVFYPNCRAVLSVVFEGKTTDLPVEVGKDADLIPMTASVHLNSYKEADTFEMEFDARKLPFSPEVIYTAAAQIHMFQSDTLDVRSVAAIMSNPDNPPSILGLADNAQDVNSKRGGRFRMDGRDYTGLMIDKKWTTADHVPTQKPLADIVQTLADKAVLRKVNGQTIGKKLTVVNLLGKSKVVESVPKELTQKSSNERRVGDGHSLAKKQGFPVPTGRTYWDVIYNLCVLHGAICYVSGDQIIIADPGALYTQSLDDVRTKARVAYGRNLSSLSFERHIGGESVPQVIVTSYDKFTRSLLAAKWPEKAKDKISGVNTLKEESLIVTVPGIRDQTLLRLIAYTKYQTLARHEAIIRFTTKNLKDFDGRDLLKLRPGNSVEINFDDIGREQLASLSVGERIKRLVGIGYEEAVAVAISDSLVWQKLKLKKPYYVRSVSIEWDKDEGMTLDVECMNFVDVARDDVQPK